MEALRPRGSAPGQGGSEVGDNNYKRMNIFKIMNLKLILVMTTNPYINLQADHLTQESIKVYNGIIPLITSLGA
jgi:hypothetical protein